MKKTNYTFGSLLFVALLASAAHAQVQRTFVSGLGSDSNPCSRTAPCRTFAQAISQTNAGGEVYVLDSAGYGAFVINKSISIVAPPGVTAGISVFSGDGIDINASGSVTVILRGLTVNNQGSTGNGILFNTGGTLHVESCVVNGFSSGTAGLLFGGLGRLEVKDSIMRGNSNGIVVQPPPGTATATIDQVRLEGNSTGLLAREGAKVTVRNSVASANSGAGIAAFSTTILAAEVNIETCVVSNNYSGLQASSTSSGGATIRVSNSTISDNDSTGLINDGGASVILSRGNNTVEGNGTNTSGFIGSYTAK